MCRQDYRKAELQKIYINQLFKQRERDYKGISNGIQVFEYRQTDRWTGLQNEG